jgi:hypothetical protein
MCMNVLFVFNIGPIFAADLVKIRSADLRFTDGYSKTRPPLDKYYFLTV